MVVIIKRTLIIGYGNPLRGDDGIGWHAVDALRRAVDNPDVRMIKVQQLTPELAQIISEYDQVIFIDANADLEPGVIDVHDVEPRDIVESADTHIFDAQSLLGYASMLYDAEPSAKLIGIGPANLSYSEELSDVVSSSLDEIVEIVKGLFESP